MRIARIQRGSGPCDDCRRGARFRITWADGSLALMLCPRCASYLASTLLSRIDEMRHGGEGD